MDAMRGMDPSSSMFHTSAARNISQIGFGAVRSQKEVAPEDDSQHEVHDDVKLSSGPSMAEVDGQEAAENASMSGEMGELADDYCEDEDEVRERHYRDEEDEKSKLIGGGSHLDGLKSEAEVQRLKVMDDPNVAVNDILKDIPQRSLEPARNIVANQIQNNRPAEALVSLKPVEGVNAVDFEPAPQIGMLDIHDTDNKPMTLDPGEDMETSQQQQMAEEQMNKLIANLPADRKAVVDEMRGAVNAWATGNGVNAQTAFAERLSDLAAGWDDESLKLASSTFADASREMSASAAD